MQVRAGLRGVGRGEPLVKLGGAQPPLGVTGAEDVGGPIPFGVLAVDAADRQLDAEAELVAHGPILDDMDRCARPLTGQLRDLALAALAGQGVAVRRLRWMGQHTNHLFRCDTAAGERLVIRVCLPGGRSDAELDAELAWLAALARDTCLTVPALRFSTRVATAGLPGGGRCIGFGWVAGRPCRHQPSRRLVADLGRVIATLHSHARVFRPPPGFTRPALDIRSLTWAGTWHANQLARRPIDPKVRHVLAETARRVDAALACLGHDPVGYGLVHADLCLENILDHHGQARPVDFDDASWGHYALDLAIAADDIPEELHPVLLRGYQTVCPLPPGYHEHQAALLAARHLYLAIWHLANGLPDDGHLGQLAAFTAPCSPAR
jgi:Ser/Thr protein kinase RdoA (MazF antagonist)